MKVNLSSIVLGLVSLCGRVEAAALTVAVAPASVQQGGVALVRVKAPQGEPLPADLAVHAGEQTLALFECPKSPQERCGLVAIAAEAKPGALEITATGAAPGSASAVTKLKVRRARFKESKLSVDPSLTHPSAEDQKRIEQEHQEVTAIYAAGNAGPLWDAGFDLPGKGGLTSRYGNRRSFNGVVKSIHQGTDLRAKTGDPVYAANAGRVALAKNMFYAGNMVILDHGMGVFTVYAHFSELGVTNGQVVKKGELLGKAGATGRVTGPHIHWGARVNNVLVDPLELRKTFNGLWKKG